MKIYILLYKKTLKCKKIKIGYGLKLLSFKDETLNL
jgi:hypothetical protein